MKIQYDDWQQEILDYQGDIMLCKGRRIGGTEIFSIKAAERMIAQPGVKIVFVSLTEDQAKLCISVALEHLTRYYKSQIGTGKLKPQQGALWTKNRSSFMVRPVGNTGNAVRGFDGDILGIDEAPWQPTMMWKAARPIISTNNGEIWMWGTPAGKEGYFWEQYDKIHNRKEKGRFKVWHKDSETVLFHRPVCDSWTEEQRDGAIRILGEERKDMTEIEYGNEYLGLFLDELLRFFSDELIKKACVLKRNPMMAGARFLGVDIGRMYDPSTFQDFCKVKDKVYHVDSQQTEKTFTNETQDKIIEMNKVVKYHEIGIDAGSGALGVGVYDNLMVVKEVRKKLRAMNNRTVSLDRYGEKKQVLKKIDYYNNLKSMMEDGRIVLLNDDEVIRSLRSIRWEITKEENVESKIRILGNYTHHCEGIIRGAWLAQKAKVHKRKISYI